MLCSLLISICSCSSKGMRNRICAFLSRSSFLLLGSSIHQHHPPPPASPPAPPPPLAPLNPLKVKSSSPPCLPSALLLSLSLAPLSLGSFVLCIVGYRIMDLFEGFYCWVFISYSMIFILIKNRYYYLILF